MMAQGRLPIYVLVTIFLSVCFLPHLSSAREVEFSWAPMPTAMKYEIQIGKSPKLEQPLMQSTIDKPTFTYNVDVGRYYYRVRAIDLKGHPGKWSQPATVMIDPYAPELIMPENNYETHYFELLPEIDFQWKSSQDKVGYEILISKATGEKVLEAPVKETTYKTSRLPEGEYTWRVRATANMISSAFSEPRKLTIAKRPLKPPTLIKPVQESLTAAYRPVEFKWEQDPSTKLSDIYFEKIKSYSPDGKTFKSKSLNLSKPEFVDPYEEPGLYKWWVVTKEGAETPGIASDVQSFELRSDVLSRGNYELEYSLSFASDLYTTTSARQTAGTSLVAQNSLASGTFMGFLGGYYFWESLGAFVSLRSARMDVENYHDLFNEDDFQLRLRFGSKGFNQEFILGYRIMDQVEAENTPTVLTTGVTQTGPLFGTRLTASITPTIKTQVNIFYYKPFQNNEGITWVNDTYGGFVAVKWNFMYQFWLGYRFAMERINSSLVTPGQSPSFTSSWTQYRTEPLYFSLSFEH